MTAKDTDMLFHFTDSDYVMNPDTHCSAVFLFAGCPGTQGSNSLSPSSTETEYAASMEAAKGAIWLWQLMCDLTQDMPQLTSCLLDNPTGQSCL